MPSRTAAAARHGHPVLESGRGNLLADGRSGSAAHPFGRSSSTADRSSIGSCAPTGSPYATASTAVSVSETDSSVTTTRSTGRSDQKRSIVADGSPESTNRTSSPSRKGDRVQLHARQRCREIRLEVPVAVPAGRPDPVTGTEPPARQRGDQRSHAIVRTRGALGDPAASSRNDARFGVEVVGRQKNGRNVSPAIGRSPPPARTRGRARGGPRGPESLRSTPRRRSLPCR